MILKLAFLTPLHHLWLDPQGLRGASELPPVRVGGRGEGLTWWLEEPQQLQVILFGFSQGGFSSCLFLWLLMEGSCLRVSVTGHHPVSLLKFLAAG